MRERYAVFFVKNFAKPAKYRIECRVSDKVQSSGMGARGAHAER